MTPQLARHVAGRGVRSGGFTLIEVIVAVGVIGVAVTVFMQLFMGSLDLARTSRDRTVAAELAEGQLGALVRNPGAFVWKFPAREDFQQFPILAAEDDPQAGVPFEAPSALPAEKTAHEVQKTVYGQFRWQAYGRLPSADAPFYEVTVVVHWTHSGRKQMVALTSAVARFRAPGAGGAA